MRIFLAGDSYSGTGPANVTKYYIENLPKGTLFQKRRSRIMRVPELIINTVRSDVIVYSGYSKQNILGMKAAKILKKPTAYIMHGCVEYENGINREPDEKMNEVERKTLELADAVYAVSAGFEKWLKQYYPLYADKIDHVTNGIDTDLAHNAKKRDKRERHMIFSIGGGMPRKKIKHVCEAVAVLRRQYDKDLYVCTIGAKGADSEEIDSYDFVKDMGLVSFEEAKRLFDDAALFIQNSSFETFGLAPVEALILGCPVLCSKEVGALELLKNLLPEDVIENYDDPEEIAEKIRFNIENPNAERLAWELEWESNSWRSRSRTLEAKLSKLLLAK